MAHSQKAKPPPLDILQSMVNGILIEIGRALRSSDKENGRSFASASTRLQTTIPSAANNFHQALDDLEIEILRAKAVIMRDLEEQRAQRIAREAPVEPIPEPEVIPEIAPVSAVSEAEHLVISPQPSPKAQDTAPSPIMEISDLPQPSSSSNNPSEAPAPQITKSEQGSTTPNSNQLASKPIGLGINTEAVPPPPTQETSGVPDSSVDSLFDVPENDAADAVINFDGMDFSVEPATDATQTQEQTDSNNFDLSTFGNDTQDFSMLDLPTTDDANATSNATSKLDDIFDDLGTNTGADTMDLDLGNMDMGEGNSFDDLFLVGDGDDDGTLGGGGEMEHGQFDRAFFGLD